MRYRFGEFVFDSVRPEIRHRDISIPLEPKAYKVLKLLVENRGRVVKKQELLAEVWQGVRVNDAAIRRVVRDLRLALGQDGSDDTVIGTHHGIGYEFLLLAEEIAESKGAPAAETLASRPEDDDQSHSKEPYGSLKCAAHLVPSSRIRRYPFHLPSLRSQDVQEVVFLDDSFLLALTLRDHPLHLRALELSEWVQIESCLLLLMEDSMNTLKKTLSSQYDLPEIADQLSASVARDPAIRIISTNEIILSQMIENYWSAAKKGFSARDCLAFFIMQTHGARHALTSNQHFERAGFSALLLEKFGKQNRLGIGTYLWPLLFLTPILVFSALARDQKILRIIQAPTVIVFGLPLAATLASYATLFLDRIRSRLAFNGRTFVQDLPPVALWIVCFFVVLSAVFWGWRL